MIAWILLILLAVAFLVLGFGDILRFSPRCALAIASVCFRQSIRRRVLWITPLAIAGVVAVSQFQRSVDPQDAVRQITMYCLFATGLLVAMVCIVLACTNLPAEIENRVIYTIATKPVTRLEIILGKVAGFAGISLCILLIMGLFTWSYLHLVDWRLRAAIAAQLPAPATTRPADASEATLRYYQREGTLHARQMGLPDWLGFYAHRPRDVNDYWMPGDDDGEISVMFRVNRSQLSTAVESALGEDFNVAVLRLGVLARPSPAPPTTQPRNVGAPRINVEFYTAARERVFGTATMKDVQVDGRNGSASNIVWNNDGRPHEITVFISAADMNRWIPSEQAGHEVTVYASLIGLEKNLEYTIVPLPRKQASPGSPPAMELLVLEDQDAEGKPIWRALRSLGPPTFWGSSACSFGAAAVTWQFTVSGTSDWRGGRSLAPSNCGR